MDSESYKTSDRSAGGVGPVESRPLYAFRYTRQPFFTFCLMGNVHSTRVPRFNTVEIVNLPPMTLARYFMF
jgi:hypothetical protein